MQKNTQNNLQYKLLLLTLKSIAWLPLNVLYKFSDMLSFIVHKLIKYRREIIRKNLRNSFPEKSDKELKQIESKFYRHFCDIFVETVKLLHISDEELGRRITIQNPNLPSYVGLGKKPIILFLGHYGNWEWVPFIYYHYGKKYPMASLYKILHSEMMNNLMEHIRSRLGIELIEKNTAYKILLSKVKNNEFIMVGFIGDQRPVNSPLKHTVTFLNQETAVMVGGETIGKRIGAKFIYLDIEQKRRGYYTFIFREMNVEYSENGKDGYPYTNLFFKYLENSINRNPSLWLWSHNRWKHSVNH